jgi:hypothetical protein
VTILATFSASQDISHSRSIVQTTNRNGLYRAENLELHSSVEIMAYTEHSVSRAAQVGLHASCNYADLQLASAGSVFGTVIQCKDRPKQVIPRMEISIQPMDVIVASTCQWATIRPENPTFGFHNLPSGTYRIAAKQVGGGPLSCSSAVISIGVGETKSNVILEVRCGELISGSVLSATDRAGISTQVKVVRGTQQLASTISNDKGGFAMEVADLPPMAEVVAGASLADGFMTARQVPRPGESVRLDLTPCERGVLLVTGLMMDRAPRLRARPLESEAEESVTLGPQDHGYSAALEPGRYHVVLLDGRAIIAGQDVVIDAGQTTEWRVGGDRISLAITLIDGLTRGAVRNGRVATDLCGGQTRWTIADTRGQVTIPGVVPGFTSLHVEADGYGRKTMTVPDSKASSLEVEIYPEATIRAVVTRGSVVRLFSVSTGLEFMASPMAEDGAMDFTGLDSGCYCVVVGSTRQLACVISGEIKTIDLRADSQFSVSCQFRGANESHVVVPVLAGAVCLSAPYEVTQAVVGAGGTISFAARDSCDYMVFGVVENNPTLLAIMKAGPFDGAVRMLDRPKCSLVCENTSTSPLAVRLSMSAVERVAFEQAMGHPLPISDMTCGAGGVVTIDGLLPGSYEVTAGGLTSIVHIDAFLGNVQIPFK